MLKQLKEMLESQEEISKRIELKQFSDDVSNLIQQTWQLIGTVNNTITNLETNEYLKNNVQNQEEIKEILNTIIDNCTIDIGMIQQVIELIDPKSFELMQTGKEQAEEIISNS